MVWGKDNCIELNKDGILRVGTKQGCFLLSLPGNSELEIIFI